MKFLLLLLLAVPCLAQVPDRGSIHDIQGHARIYVVADGDAYKAIGKTIGKALTVVDKASDAEFFLEYKTISRSTVPPTGMTLENGELIAYVMRGKEKVIAWSDSMTAGGFKGDTAAKLTRKFLKALK